VEEEANVVSVETKNIRQDSALERGEDNIEKGTIINTGANMFMAGKNWE
jgi:hypothetical protein